jgi:hypothetical protein
MLHLPGESFVPDRDHAMGERTSLPRLPVETLIIDTRYRTAAIGGPAGADA